MNPVIITSVDELCGILNHTMDDQDRAQMKIESILNYLQDWGVIENYNADKLDWIFSNNESN